MASFIRIAAKTLVLTSVALAGCAGDGSESFFTTGALGTTQAAAPESKVDPACVTLGARIDALRKEGVAEKIEKAAAKKYKMTQSDLTKADQLTKANADFQFRCSTVMPKSVFAPAASPSSAPTAKPAPKAASAGGASQQP